jgi:hypothetical protein
LQEFDGREDEQGRPESTRPMRTLRSGKWLLIPTMKAHGGEESESNGWARRYRRR